MTVLSRRFLAICLSITAAPALAAPDPVVIGATPNNGQGDPFRTAAIKLNKNDADLYAAIQAIRSNIASLAFAPLVSPNFTGVPRAPTPPQGTTGTQIATVDFVSAASSGRVPTSRKILVGGLATGGGDLTADRTITVPKAAQSDVATGTDDAKALTSLSVAARFAALAPLASPAFTGTPTAPTAAVGTNTTQIATTGFVVGALSPYLTSATAASTYAPLASPALTGSPTAPTQAANDNSTKLATTAYADRAATAAPYVVAESLGANGYRRWSDGYTEQWGTTSSTSADFTLTFPIAFANNCWGVTTNPNNGGAGGSAAYVTSSDTFTKTTAILRGRTVSNGGSVAAQPNLSIVWRAWGN